MTTVAHTIAELYDAEPPTSTPAQDTQPSGVAWRNYNDAPTTSTPHPTPEAVATVSFDAALLQATSRAKAAYPAEHVRIERGLQIAIGEGVTLLADGTALVQSQTHTNITYRVNGHCSCADMTRAPEGRCKHLWSKSLVKWALKAGVDTPAVPIERRCPSCLIMQAFAGECCDFCAELPAVFGDGAAELQAAPAIPVIPVQYVVTLHGKSFIQYQGLLAMAHARGLVSLKAHFVSVTETLALAEAEATFVDGTTYGESADSTPQNVGTTVRAHFPRIALTRAKARCLRDALNIGMCSLEELGEA